MQYLAVGGFGSLGGAPFENFEVDDHGQVGAFTSDCRCGGVVEVAAADMQEGVGAALRRHPTVTVTVAGGACFGVEDRTRSREDRLGPFRVQDTVYTSDAAECGRYVEAAPPESMVRVL